ncbi:calcineurin-binding protein cabin-1-like [Sabethes cyaneus]|uniref:calcineurin-binding protein cabin-1-like n=1 Tax=Sabethes cyaneus TaxID=53552 RepID=UPI00237EC0F6|nr:calcineurin-binding protein cabin-1-like [Sabethes cyaneus]
MLRICALNEESDDSCSSDDSQTAESKPDEETSVMTEYLDALRFKDQNQLEHALAIFLKLLDVEMLKNISDSGSKLYMIKYNSHRNIGLIYKDKGDSNLAIEHLSKAVEMDETDVHTVYCLGKLAFGSGRVHIAKICYEKCVERNPDHWPSIEGLLQVFCVTGNVIEAFSWAMHCYKKDSTYPGALNVLAEIKTHFFSTVPFLEELFDVVVRKDEMFSKCAVSSKRSYFHSRMMDIS